MKFFVFFTLTFLFVAYNCSTSKKAIYYPNPLPQATLGNMYKSVDTEDSLTGEVTENYINTCLKQVIKDRVFHFLINDTVVFCGDYKMNDYLFEVWNNTHLMISITSKEFPAYGPDGTKRDSVYIIDLETSKIGYVSLKNIYLTRNAWFLTEIPKEYDYYIIQDIDVENYRLSLYNNEFATKTYHLITIEKASL